MVQVESAWAITMIVAVVSTLGGIIGFLFKQLIANHNRQHEADAAEILYLRGLLSQVAGSAQVAASAGHEAVSLGLAATERSRGRTTR